MSDTASWLLPNGKPPGLGGQTIFQFGEGTFFLWQDCAARKAVFRQLFEGWGTGFGNQPGFPEGLPPGYTPFDACP